jgi:hypothetical protein
MTTQSADIPPASQPTPEGKLKQRQQEMDYNFKVVIAMIIVLALSAIITLLTIQEPSAMVYTPQTPDPSPLGYTWSLVLFIIPAVVLKWWFVRHPHYHVEKKAYWLTIAILTPLGFCLDLFFGNSFFLFPNQAATVGLRLPGFTFGQGWIGGSIPIEEFLFYFTGFITILLIYVWGNIYWFEDYSVSDDREAAQALKQVFSFHWPLAIGSLVLIGAAILYKNVFAPPDYRGGFPGYFVFEMLVGVVPTVVLFRAAKQFINWRAFSFSLFFLLFLSLLWEGTLGTPYGWWDYQPAQMLGIVMKPWANLPLEAVILWFVATWITIIMYEVIKIVDYMERGVGGALLGTRKG